MAALLFRRRKAEMAAGPLLERLETGQSRWIFWLLTALMLGLYFFSIWSHLQTAASTNVPVVLFGNPLFLLLAVNFAVVRGWWKIDPRAIEVCEHGIILGGFRFIPWEDLLRFSWTGNPIRQLNLYCRGRTVLNFGLPAKMAERLEPILRERVKS